MKTIKLEEAFKKAFEKWYIEEYLYYGLFGIKVQKLAIKSFYWQKISKQYGVYKIFANSKGIEISTYSNGWNISTNMVSIEYDGVSESLEQAMLQAVLKLQSLYNEK